MRLTILLYLISDLLICRTNLAFYVNCANPFTDSCACISQESSNLTCFDVTTGEQLKKRFSLMPHTTVHSISIANCGQLTSLPSRVFNAVKAKHLVIQRTGLSCIENNAFKGFAFEDSLETLNLYQNNFENFNFKSLTKLKNLRGFRITSDHLTNIPEYAFSNFPSLNYIDLSHNHIESIDKNAFYNLSRIQLIDLRANKLMEIDEDSFNLHNSSTRVTVLLSSNEISRISNNSFTNLKIKHLELENNKLKTLTQSVFKPLLDYFNSSDTEPGVLYVKGNPFKCDSSIEWLVKETTSYKSQVAGFQCENNGKRLSQLNETDLLN